MSPKTVPMSGSEKYDKVSINLPFYSKSSFLKIAQAGAEPEIFWFLSNGAP